MVRGDPRSRSCVRIRFLIGSVRFERGLGDLPRERRGERRVRTLASAPPRLIEKLHEISFRPVCRTDFFEIGREFGFFAKRFHQAPDALKRSNGIVIGLDILPVQHGIDPPLVDGKGVLRVGFFPPVIKLQPQVL